MPYLLLIYRAWSLYLWNIESMFSRAKGEARYFTSTDWTSEVNKWSIIWLYWSIIDTCKARERQIKTCNSVVISQRISSLTSLYIVSFPFLIVRNTFSLHMLSKIWFLFDTSKVFLKPPWAGNTGNVRPIMSQSNFVFGHLAATAI